MGTSSSVGLRSPRLNIHFTCLCVQDPPDAFDKDPADGADEKPGRDNSDGEEQKFPKYLFADGNGPKKFLGLLKSAFEPMVLLYSKGDCQLLR